MKIIKNIIRWGLSYETPKLIEIHNFKIGIFQRVLQLLIAVYVVCWVIIYEKGYQNNDSIVSAVVTKVRGVLYVNDTKEGSSVIDAADIVKPSLENNAFFVLTHRIVTERQKPSKCHAIFENPHINCVTDADCNQMEVDLSDSGILTGKCLNNLNVEGKCEMYAWCPPENDTILIDHEKETFKLLSMFTVYIKNEIEYPNFKVKSRNRNAWISDKPLGSCRYNSSDPIDQYCPIFKLSSIFKQAGINYHSVTKGGIIGIMINWDCNLDFGVESCKPVYSFTNMEPEKKEEGGFNFRYANYYRENGVLYRDLIKAFGFRFLIFVHGTAGKLSIIPLMVNVGSGLALLGIAPTVCDIIILNFLGSKTVYSSAKFEKIHDDKFSSEKQSKYISDEDVEESGLQRRPTDELTHMKLQTMGNSIL